MRWHIREKEKLRFTIIYNKMAKAYLKCQYFQKGGEVALLVVRRKTLLKARLTIMRILLFFDNTTGVNDVKAINN
jgi:hypothetical protein